MPRVLKTSLSWNLIYVRSIVLGGMTDSKAEVLSMKLKRSVTRTSMMQHRSWMETLLEKGSQGAIVHGGDYITGTALYCTCRLTLTGRWVHESRRTHSAQSSFSWRSHTILTTLTLSNVDFRGVAPLSYVRSVQRWFSWRRPTILFMLTVLKVDFRDVAPLSWLCSQCSRLIFVA